MAMQIFFLFLTQILKKLKIYQTTLKNRTPSVEPESVLLNIFKNNICCFLIETKNKLRSIKKFDLSLI